MKKRILDCLIDISSKISYGPFLVVYTALWKWGSSTFLEEVVALLKSLIDMKGQMPLPPLIDASVSDPFHSYPDPPCPLLSSAGLRRHPGAAKASYYSWSQASAAIPEVYCVTNEPYITIYSYLGSP